MPRARKLGYGEGTVYFDSKREIWIGEITIDGQRHRRSGGVGGTRSDAVAKLDKLRSDAAVGLPVGDATRLGDWIDWYFDKVILADSDLDLNTVANYRWAFAKLAPLRGMRLRDLKAEHIESLFRKLATEKTATPAQKRRGGHSRPLGRSSLGRIRMALGVALAEAERRDHVPRNVARFVHLPKTAPPAVKRALSRDEANALLEAVKGDRHEALFLVAIMIGLRPGEVLGLPWTAVDLTNRTLEVRQALHRKPGGGVEIGKVKADSYRTIRLPSPVVDALRKHKRRQVKEELAAPVWEKSGLVFTTAIGTPMDFSNLRRNVKAVCEKAQVPTISPNELRHSAATLLMEAGVPIQQAADMFGHTDMRMMATVYRHKRGVVDVTDGQERMLGTD